VNVKPGDLLKHRPTGDTIEVEMVDRAHDLISSTAGRYLRLSECTLQTSAGPEHEQQVVMKGCRGGDDTRSRWCRAEARRRGWRPVELTDCTASPLLESITVDGQQIGLLSVMEGESEGWVWALGQVPPTDGSMEYEGPEATRQAALTALLVAENARRQEPKQPTKKAARNGK
jgi:hypothetical protein